jgi:hypothetical protein
LENVKRPFRKSKRRWEDNIKMVLKEIVYTSFIVFVVFLNNTAGREPQASALLRPKPITEHAISV